LFRLQIRRVNDITWLTTVQMGGVALLSISVARFGEQPLFVWHPGIFWTPMICTTHVQFLEILLSRKLGRGGFSLPLEGD
jgi:hypothetical protein